MTSIALMIASGADVTCGISQWSVVMPGLLWLLVFSGGNVKPSCHLEAFGP